MKVHDSAISAVPTVTTRAASAARPEEEVKDKVSFTTPQQEATIQYLRATVAPSRANRVEEVVSAVRSGQYYPSPQQIAQKLVSEAEVEVQLRAIMAK